MLNGFSPGLGMMGIARIEAIVTAKYGDDIHTSIAMREYAMSYLKPVVDLGGTPEEILSMDEARLGL